MYNADMAGNKNSGDYSKYSVSYSRSKLKAYLKSCKDKDIKKIIQESDQKGYKMYKTILKIKLPSVEGYAMFLGFSRRTLYNWADENKEFESSLDKIKAAQKQKLVEHGLDGSYNAAIARLILSTNHGMTERSDITSGGKAIPLFDYAKKAGDNNSNEED